MFFGDFVVIISADEGLGLFNMKTFKITLIQSDADMSATQL